MHQNREFVVILAVAALVVGVFLSMAAMDKVQAESAQPGVQKAVTVPPSAKETAVKALKDIPKSALRKAPRFKLAVDLEIKEVTVCPGYSAGPAIWPEIHNNSNFTVKATVYVKPQPHGLPQRETIEIGPHGMRGPLFLVEGGKRIDIWVKADKNKFAESKGQERDNTCQIAIGRVNPDDGDGYCGKTQKCKRSLPFRGPVVEPKK